MPQPTASVDIANLALDHLGQTPIASLLDPATVSADILARWYDTTRRKVLRKYIFNSARKTSFLTASANAPVHPEFVNGYALPNDFIRLLTLGDRILFGGNIPTEFFDFSNGYLYCDDLTDQGTGAVTPQPSLSIAAIYRSGDVVAGVTVPPGSTVIVPLGGVPIPGAQYLISAVQGAVQANGNTFMIVPGTLGNAGAVFFLQTASGQNFDSASWGVYVSGGTATPTYVPPYSTLSPSGLEMSYVFDATNVRAFDPLFIDVLALQLAVDTCKQITKKGPSQELMARLLDAQTAAAAVAGQEKPPRRVQRSRIRAVRRSGGIYRNNTVIDGWGN